MRLDYSLATTMRQFKMLTKQMDFPHKLESRKIENKSIFNPLGREQQAGYNPQCSVQRDCLDRLDKGRNTLSFIKDVAIRFLNETFIPDKALYRFGSFREWVRSFKQDLSLWQE